MIQTTHLICESCAKDILPKEKAVLVSYGYIAKSGKFYCKKGVDYFHADCDGAFRD